MSLIKALLKFQLPAVQVTFPAVYDDLLPVSKSSQGAAWVAQDVCGSLTNL
jgi:hypothetical protein